MKIYNFYDTNIYGDQNDNYNIEGKDYERLIDFCCKYCAFVSFEMTGEDIQLFEALEKYRVDTPTVTATDENQLFYPRRTARFYMVCPQVNALLKKNAKSIFEWINGWGYKNPENPAFYRKDGSIFFCSEIHEGWCTLMPNDDEEVEEVISDPKWLKEDHVGFKYEIK